MLGARALEPRKLGEALGPRGHWSAGKDFEPEITLASVRRRIREWAKRSGYSLEEGWVVATRTVRHHPTRGKTYRELKGVSARDRSTREEYGLAVQLVRNREKAKRRLRQYRRS